MILWSSASPSTYINMPHILSPANFAVALVHKDFKFIHSATLDNNLIANNLTLFELPFFYYYIIIYRL